MAQQPGGLGRRQQGLRHAALRGAATGALPHDLGQGVPAEPGTFRPIVPEIIELQRQLDAWQLTRAQLVDVAILIGTDFNDGVKGIGPKKALRLVQAHGRIEDMPAEVRDAVGDPSEVRDIYLHPAVTDDYPDAVRGTRCRRRHQVPVRRAHLLARARHRRARARVPAGRPNGCILTDKRFPPHVRLTRHASPRARDGRGDPRSGRQLASPLNRGRRSTRTPPRIRRASTGSSAKPNGESRSPPATGSPTTRCTATACRSTRRCGSATTPTRCISRFAATIPSRAASRPRSRGATTSGRTTGSVSASTRWARDNCRIT